MLSAYCRIDLVAGEIATAIDIAEHSVHRVPSNGRVYRIVFPSGFAAILATTKKVKSYSSGLLTLSLFVFDKEIEVDIDGLCDLLLTSVASSSQYQAVELEVVTDAERRKLGRLLMCKNGTTTFDNEDIGTERAQRLYTKAITLSKDGVYNGRYNKI